VVKHKDRIQQRNSGNWLRDQEGYFVKRILCVDDEGVILECFERTLGIKGYTVSTTSDSEKALEIIGKEDFDLIMLDVNMPKANGFEIYEQIKKNNKPVAVLFVTGYPASFTSQSEPVAHLWKDEFSDGNTDILYKPFHIETLIEKVEGLIGPVEGSD